MSETGSFLNSPAGQVALIGGVAFTAWYVLRNYGKDTAKAVTETGGTFISNIYEGSKDFGKELASDTTAAAANLGNILSGIFDWSGISGALGQGSTQNQQIEAVIATAKVNLSKEGLLKEIVRLKAEDTAAAKVQAPTPTVTNYAERTGTVPVATSVTGATIYGPTPTNLASYLTGTQAVLYGLPVTPVATVASKTTTPAASSPVTPVATVATKTTTPTPTNLASYLTGTTTTSYGLPVTSTPAKTTTSSVPAASKTSIASTSSVASTAGTISVKVSPTTTVTGSPAFVAAWRARTGL